ncbi:MAG: YkgJ family cysteine cluster protein [Thermodesulfobacteriota bacterium]|nr:YkgJ family cysteine cluster protein [Thermodesulfobacteriota bacterium]
MRNFVCKGCGNCCLYASFSEVGEEDVRVWERKGRADILKWVRPRSIGHGEYAYEVWIDPKTGSVAERCPWLEKLPATNHYICQIHDVKPTICRYFPASVKHAQEVGCKGLQEKGKGIVMGNGD